MYRVRLFNMRDVVGADSLHVALESSLLCYGALSFINPSSRISQIGGESRSIMH